MNDIQKILSALADLKGAIEEQRRQQNSRMDTLEFKMEAFHAEQTKANQEIINLLVSGNEANGEAHKELEKQVDRIEKHLNLPPVK